VKIYADNWWRAGDFYLGDEWQTETLMEVYGNASSLLPHSKLPQPILDWLAGNSARRVVFLRDCNTMNLDLPAGGTLEDGGTPVHVEIDVVIGYEDYVAPDGTVVRVEVRGNRVVV
jgi:hypothetical protein